MERNNYFECSERRNEWFNCLSAFDNWLSRHSQCIKITRLNNINGVHKIIMELFNNLDRFMYEQEDLEITVPANEKKK